MLLNIIVDIIAGIFTALNGLIPNIPTMPTEISDIADTLSTSIATGWGTIVGFFGVGFMVAVLGMVIAIINFTHVYHLILWVLRKLPIGTQ